VSLTALFVRRPTLVVVALALVLLAGALAFLGLVQQNFPNIDFPTVQTRLTYPGASTTEIRDAIVKPIEDAIAGAPDLDHINTSIQQGQATVTATFALGSDQTSDLVEVQRRVQSTRAILPTDLAAPSIGTFDPAQTVVATLSASSKSLTQAALSAIITNNIVPELEQIDGVSNVNANGTVTPAIEVDVDPNKLNAENFTLGDVVTSISNNNIRAPGGIAYGAARETTIDVRGDITDPKTVANLPLFASTGTGTAVITGPQGGTGLQSPANASSTGTTAATSNAVAGSGAVAVATAAAAGATTSTTTAAGGTTAASASNSSATSASAASSQTTASSVNVSSAASAPTTAPASTSSSNTAGSSTGASGTSATTATSSSSGTAATTGSSGTSSSSGSTILINQSGATTSSSTSGVLTGSGTSTATSTGTSTGTSTARNSTAASAGSSGSSIPAPAPIATIAPAATTSVAVSASTSSPSPTATATPYGLTSSFSIAQLGTTTASGTAPSAATTTFGNAASASSPVSGSTGSSSASSGASSSSTSGLNQWSVASRVLRVSDIAHVYNGYEIKRVFGYVGAGPAVSLNVQKATGASEITASQSVLAELPKLQAEYPAISLQVLNVQADYTQQQLNSVYRSIAEGILFTGIVMLFFLRSWRNAIVVLIAIPASLLVTLFVMRLANFTIDTISLLAMTLLIGILVDDSIVVLENTERHYDDGEAPQTAAILGRTEIGAAALVITLVDVVVFLPIAFLPGTVGRFLAEFGLVVTVATLTSLAVSFTITPALAGNWSLLSRWKPPWIVNAFTRGFEASRRLYVDRVLGWALGHKVIVAIVSFLLVGGAISLIPLGYVGFEFIPAVDRGEVFLQLTFPPGTPLTTTNAAISSLEKKIATYKDVKRLTGTAGSYQSGFGGGTNEGSAGQIHVFLVDKPKRTTLQWVATLNKLAQSEYPLAKPVAIPATGTGGGNAQPIDYVITSLDDAPEKYAPAILAALKATPGSLNANDSLENLSPQVDVYFDRERARGLGIDIATAANAVRASFGATQVAQFETARGIQYVQVTYPQSAQTSVNSINHIPIRTQAGSLAYVGDVARLVEDPTAPLMSRVNRQTVVHIASNVEPGATQSIVQKAFLQRVAALHLPPGVKVAPNAGGQGQDLVQTVQGLGASLLLSFALVYLLMVALYDSYRLPFIIMFAIPVAAVGAIGSLAITGQTLNLFSLIGTVMLVGLASKNGILLVDFANHRIRRGIDRYAAIRESAFERFRPIVMTTFSMIAGMTPIALALDPGSSVRRSLGIVVIGGLISSLLLTFLLVPVAFVWFAPRHPIPEPEEGDVSSLAAVAGAPV
jgi:HAE1 family hydrophobic/amphiphilic exporter-1